MRTLLTSVAAGLLTLGVTSMADAQKSGRSGNSGQGQRHGGGQGQMQRQGNGGQHQGQGQANQQRTRDFGAAQVGVPRQPGADVSVTRHKGGKGHHLPGDGHNHGGNWKHYPGDGHKHGGNWSGNWKHYPGDGHNHNWHWNRPGNWNRPNNNWYWRNPYAYGNNWRWGNNNNWGWNNNYWRYGNNWGGNNNNYWRWLPIALRFLNGGMGFPGYGGFGYGGYGAGYPYYGGGYGGYYAYDTPTYVATDSVASAPAPTPAADQAVVHVVLPDANAEVSLNGEKIESSGRERDFFSPQLESGRQYTYTVTASWSLGDRRVGDSRTITVTPGQRTVVDFTRPAATTFTSQPISR